MASLPESVVAHSVVPYLPRSGSWIHSQLVLLERWRAIVLTKRIENQATFPFSPVYSRETLSPPRRLVERALHRLRGYWPFWAEAVRREKARLLHSHFGDRACRDVPLVRYAEIPQVASFYGADIWRLGLRAEWRERYARLFETGRVFLVEGQAMRRRVIELGCEPDKVRVQHLGVQLDRIQWSARRPGADGVVRFLAVGRLEFKKGHELAIRAFARVRRELPRSELGMILIAPQSRAQEALAPIHAAIREEGLESAVKVHGYMPYPKYLEALADHHIFLQPSRHAPDGDAEGGAPVSLIEMSAAGMPVVGSRHCDIPEVVVDGASGRIFPEGDIDAMATAMLDIGGRPEAWEGFGRAGRAHIEAQYDATTQARRLEEIYDEVVAST